MTKLLPTQLNDLTGSLIPEEDDKFDLGDATHEFKDAYIDGLAYIDEAQITELGANTVVEGHVFPLTTVTTEATADDITYTAAQIIGGYIIRDPAGAARTDTTATAALICAAITGCMVGTTVEFSVRNNDGGAAETITVAGGANVTASGTMTITTGQVKKFFVIFTNVTGGSEAAALHSMGTSTW